MREQIEQFILGRRDEKLKEFDKQTSKKLAKEEDLDSLRRLKEKLEQEREQLEKKYLVADWIADAAKRAKQIRPATHVLKFIHTDAKGANIYFPGGSPCPDVMTEGELVTTASLEKECRVDVVGNAAALDVAAFLQISDQEKVLLDLIREGETSALAPYATSEEQLVEWQAGFEQALIDRIPSTHTLGKQVYFPVGEEQYHLVAPLFASSFAHALYERISSARFSDDAKEARKSRKAGEYSSSIVIDYPRIAKQSFGGSNPQNVSQLNSKRRGKIFLFSCSPPAGWKSQVKVPLEIKTVFSRGHLGRYLKSNVEDLKKFIRRHLKRPSNQAVRDERASIVDDVIEKAILYAAEVQALRDRSGWSLTSECKLSRAEMLWLDSGRAAMEPEFASERDKGEWQSVIAESFASWICRLASSKKFVLGDSEKAEIKSLVIEKLRSIDADLEVFD